MGGMMKNLAILLMGLNTFFLITNAVLLYVGETPIVSLVSAFACLCGLGVAWNMYESIED